MSTDHLFAPLPPPTSSEAWRRRVDEELGGDGSARKLGLTGPEGLARHPLVTAEDLPRDASAALPHRARLGRGWTIAQEYRRGDASRLAPEIAADVAQGVRLVWIASPDFDAGDELTELLAGLDPEVETVVEAYTHPLAVAAAFTAAGAPRGGVVCDPPAVRMSLGDDADVDRLYTRLAELVGDTASSVRRPVLVASTPYHEAGASAVEELALVLSGAVEALRRLESLAIPPADTAAALRFAVSLGDDLFLEIAKLRAARLLWSKVTRTAGLPDAAAEMRLHTRTSRKHLADDDPWTHLLRGTVETFAAAVGGAGSIAVVPCDELAGPGEPWSRRLAVNIQHILGEEAHLGRLVDPVGGSYAVEHLTDDLARAAWELFREIEGRGGLVASLADGWVTERLATTETA